MPDITAAPDAPTAASPSGDRADTKGRLIVLSCGTAFPEGLSREAQAALEGADFIYGSLRALDALPRTLHARRYPLGRTAVESAAQALDMAMGGKSVCVLGSGDALYHGIGGTIVRLLQDFAPEEGTLPAITFLPGITAFQELCHRMGLPWDDTALFSCHNANPALGPMLASRLSIIYAGYPVTAQALAAKLIVFQPEAASRMAILAEKLGTPDERILKAPLEVLAKEAVEPTAMLVLLPEGAEAPTLPLGLPDEAWEIEKHLITQPDVRAVALSRLRLPAWGVFWDLGAGSGSVGLEAAALCPGLTVWAVEKEHTRTQMIRANAARRGVVNFTVLEGTLPRAMAALPSPDRVFVGGGGTGLPAILKSALDELRPGGILIVSAVTLETLSLLWNFHPELRETTVSLDVAEEAPIGQTRHRLRADSRIHLVIFRKEAQAETPQRNPDARPEQAGLPA